MVQIDTLPAKAMYLPFIDRLSSVKLTEELEKLILELIQHNEKIRYLKGKQVRIELDEGL